MGISAPHSIKDIEELKQAAAYVMQNGVDRIVSLATSIHAMGDLAHLADFVEKKAAVYWRDPKNGTEFFAFDTARSFEVKDGDPISLLREAYAQFAKNVWNQHKEDVRFFLSLPFYGGQVQDKGFFAKWPFGWLLLPRYLVTKDSSGNVLFQENFYLDPQMISAFNIEQAITHFVQMRDAFIQQAKNEMTLETHSISQENDSLDKSTWENNVLEAIQTLQKGSLKKIVLARHVTLTMSKKPVASAIIAKLRARFTDSAVFVLFHHGSLFAGASPERLVTVNQNNVDVDCLAGTASRSHSPEVDQRLGEQLLHSPKNREEHQMVVDGIREELAHVVRNLHIPDEPRLKKLSNVQHLYTPVTAQLLPTWDALSLLAKLHPTPAVAGLPKDKAVDYLIEHESWQRGFYAAPIGFIDASGNLDCYVALRSALIEGKKAVLFAGAGITKDSDPEMEYIETEWKMNPMREALDDFSQGKGV